MSEASAKVAMRLLAVKAQEVVKDETKSFSERREALDKIEAEIKGHADQVAVHVKARELAGGAGSAPEAKAAEAPVQAKSFPAQVTDSGQFKAFASAVDQHQRASATV